LIGLLVCRRFGVGLPLPLTGLAVPLALPMGIGLGLASDNLVVSGFAATAEASERKAPEKGLLALEVSSAPGAAISSPAQHGASASLLDVK